MTRTVFTQDSADKLLDKLANDDSYREHLLGDPVGALAHIGFHLDPSEVPPVRHLPSKQSVTANRAAIKTKLTGTAGMVVFFM
jgi:putative modified peptide